MNNEKNFMETYETPVVAVYEIEIERVFAASTETYELNEEQDW